MKIKFVTLLFLLLGLLTAQTAQAASVSCTVKDLTGVFRALCYANIPTLSEANRLADTLFENDLVDCYQKCTSLSADLCDQSASAGYIAYTAQAYRYCERSNLVCATDTDCKRPAGNGLCVNQRCSFYTKDGQLCKNSSQHQSSYECTDANQCLRFDQGNCEQGFCCLTALGQKILDETPLIASLGKDLEIKKPLLEIRFPGLSFTDVSNTLDNEGYIHLPYIGEFISAMYKFGMAVGSILAVVLLIITGTKIIASGGGEEKVAGFKRIGQIVIGLFIMWGSYAILYTINPDLVNFKILKILYIQKQEMDGSEAGSEKPTGIAGDCGGAAGHTQTLDSSLGLSGDVYKFSHYSTKFGSTCTKPAPAIKAIVLHYTINQTSASASGIVKFWSDPNQSPGSICQIIVDGTGKAYQVTDKLEEHVICQGGSSGFQFNDGGIGIEIVGMNETDLIKNTAQKNAVIELVKKLTAKYNIPKTNKVADLMNTSGGGGIFTHRQITHCEGAPKLKEDAGEAYAQQIITGAGGTYTDWTKDPNCQKK